MEPVIIKSRDEAPHTYVWMQNVRGSVRGFHPCVTVLKSSLNSNWYPYTGRTTASQLSFLELLLVKIAWRTRQDIDFTFRQDTAPGPMQIVVSVHS